MKKQKKKNRNKTRSPAGRKSNTQFLKPSININSEGRNAW